MSLELSVIGCGPGVNVLSNVLLQNILLSEMP